MACGTGTWLVKCVIYIESEARARPHSAFLVVVNQPVICFFSVKNWKAQKGLGQRNDMIRFVFLGYSVVGRTGCQEQEQYLEVI